MTNLSDEKIEAQLTKYFQKVICNAASNYYKKKNHQKEKEYVTEEFYDELIGESNFEDNMLTQIIVKRSPLSIFNNTIDVELNQLTRKEQQFLIEKFIFYKTDKEIGMLQGVSRQAVTNMKHRLYKKIRDKLEFS